MTQKSLARQARDAQQAEAKKTLKAQKDALKKNNCWDDLNDLHATAASVFIRYAQLGTYMKNQALMECVTDPKIVGQRIAIMTRDLQNLKAELAKIHATHSGKNGGPIGGDMDTQAADLVNSLEIYQHYQMWMEKHDAVVLPVYTEIMAALTQAEQKLKTVVSAVTGESMEEINGMIKQNAGIANPSDVAAIA